MKKKFPLENKYDSNIVPDDPMIPQESITLKVNEEDLQAVIDKLAQGRSQGPSGLGNAHIRALSKQVRHFVPALAAFFQELLDNPDLVDQYPAFFQFRIVWIPKKSGGHRPISVHEPFLIAVHRVLV